MSEVERNVSHEESAQALLRAGGKCRRCSAAAISIARWHPDGWWAQFDFKTGTWLGPKGRRVPAHEIAKVRDTIIRLRAVRVARTAPWIFAGRVIALCQACEEILQRPPAPARPSTMELPL